MQKIVFDRDSRDALVAGVNKIANAVKATLGPRGRNAVLFNGMGAPHVTKDGVSVAKFIELSDSVENAGARLVKEVAMRTGDQAGDGTTTATVIAQAILNEGIKHVAAGFSPIEIKRGIDTAVESMIEFIEKSSQKVETPEDWAKVASISANNDSEIGKIIAEAFAAVGKDGIVRVEASRDSYTRVVTKDGVFFEKGYVSPYFVTDPRKMEIVLDNSLIFIYDGTIRSFGDIVNLLNYVATENKPILIIAKEFDVDVTSNLLENVRMGRIRACAVRAPYAGERQREVLEDLAFLTGAKLFTTEVDDDIKLARISDLGFAKNITVGQYVTSIVGGKTEKSLVDTRYSELEELLKNAKTDEEEESIKARLGRLSGAIAIIEVGANTESEMKEKKDRIDDALHATRAAIEKGVVPGGGVMLLRAATEIEKLEGENEDQNIGIQIVRRASKAPLQQIAVNAGKEPSVIIRDVELSDDFNFGYNARSGKFCNMVDSGIIDPAKVTISALRNGSGIASLILTTSVVVANVDKKEDVERKIINEAALYA